MTLVCVYICLRVRHVVSSSLSTDNSSQGNDTVCQTKYLPKEEKQEGGLNAKDSTSHYKKSKSAKIGEFVIYQQ